MNLTLPMDFSVDKENKTITVARAFAADLPLVWDAFTKSELLDQWWAPKPWKARTKSMDFREGGHWQYAMMGPDGDEQWCLVSYRTIEPQSRFTALNEFTDADKNSNPGMPKSDVETRFEPTQDGSRVVLQYSFTDLAHLEEFINMGFREGMGMALDNLESLLSTR